MKKDTIVERLKKLRKRAAFETARFSPEVQIFHRTGLPIDPDTFIKVATKQYLESWILPEIDRLVAYFEKKAADAKARKDKHKKKRKQ